MNGRMIGMTAAMLLLGGLASAPVWADDTLRGPKGRMGPPPEAIEACKDKAEGTAVEFTNRRGETVKATCKQWNGKLVAVPEGGHHRPKGPAGPPGGTQEVQ